MKKAILILIVLSLVSCEKTWLGIDPADDAVTNFDLVWSTVDHKYSFFTYKRINWDSIYQVYRPLVSSSTNSFELFVIIGNMLNELKDGHVNLISAFDRSRYWDWKLDYPPNFDWHLIERNYLGDDHLITGPLRNTVLDNTIGYIYYGSFGSPVSESNIDFIVGSYRNAEGIIIDIRDNGGGSLSNVETIASRFTDEKKVVGMEYFKTGPGHDDFTGGRKIIVKPEGERQFTKPVIVLTNRACFSASTFFVMYMKAFPHVTVIGSKTGGGGGMPISSELPNGWLYRFSSTITTMPDGFNIENGIEPDIQVDLDTTKIQEGVDTMIEAAIDFIKSR